LLPPPEVFGTLKVKAKRLVFGEIEEEVIELSLNGKGAVYGKPSAQLKKTTFARGGFLGW
jgi:hypothetical protein